MARRKEPADDELRLLIVNSVTDLGDEMSEDVATRVMAALRPVIGAAAQRRRNENSLLDAFREGFFTGQKVGKWHRWHTMIWKHSMMFRRLKAQDEQSVQNIVAAARYAEYNY